MSSVHRSHFVRSFSACSLIAIGAIAACGGSTDIDFTGETVARATPATAGMPRAGRRVGGTGGSLAELAGQYGTGGIP
jgi:hypothetical protein